jgi:hypothetical protein
MGIFRKTEPMPSEPPMEWPLTPKLGLNMDFMYMIIDQESDLGYLYK